MIDKRNTSTQSMDTIDFDKLKMLLRKNILWLLLVIVGANLATYLYLRYTKNVYEASSEVKLTSSRTPPNSVSRISRAKVRV